MDAVLGIQLGAAVGGFGGCEAIRSPTVWKRAAAVRKRAAIEDMTSFERCELAGCFWTMNDAPIPDETLIDFCNGAEKGRVSVLIANRHLWSHRKLAMWAHRAHHVLSSGYIFFFLCVRTVCRPRALSQQLPYLDLNPTHSSLRRLFSWAS